MSRVIYEFLKVHITDLEKELSAINKCQDKIIAVTQNGNVYTIFYERNGNEKDGK